MGPAELLSFKRILNGDVRGFRQEPGLSDATTNTLSNPPSMAYGSLITYYKCTCWRSESFAEA
ncbi:hypothetical protein N7478_009535 [Penicillium angulare]|uniref:uncharacterized protein n=1 Tax=Penicillium angulare TaxID=116970 RepID=UPI00254144BC|nr:uncharacterized protein N7478_009535 [Penicillium angulare]KAJ5266727.1 hypothetical protein N7478_009535 [Penicillium angulare]